MSDPKRSRSSGNQMLPLSSAQSSQSHQPTRPSAPRPGATRPVRNHSMQRLSPIAPSQLSPQHRSPKIKPLSSSRQSGPSGFNSLRTRPSKPVRTTPGVSQPMPVVNSEARNPSKVGLTRQEYQAFQAYAMDTGNTPVVRTGGQTRTDQMTSGLHMRPKPEAVYAKTKKFGRKAGFVGADRNTVLPVLGETFTGSDDLTLRDPNNNPIVGDLDMQTTLSPMGKTVDTTTFTRDMNQRLKSAKVLPPIHGSNQYHDSRKDRGIDKDSLLQHESHDSWEKKDDKTYLGGLNRGILPGQLAFLPDGRTQLMTQTPHYSRFLETQGAQNPYTQDSRDFSLNRDAGAGDITITSAPSVPDSTVTGRALMPPISGPLTTAPLAPQTSQQSSLPPLSVSAMTLHPQTRTKGSSGKQP